MGEIEDIDRLDKMVFGFCDYVLIMFIVKYIFLKWLYVLLFCYYIFIKFVYILFFFSEVKNVIVNVLFSCVVCWLL